MRFTSKAKNDLLASWVRLLRPSPLRPSRWKLTGEPDTHERKNRGWMRKKERPTLEQRSSSSEVTPQLASVHSHWRHLLYQRVRPSRPLCWYTATASSSWFLVWGSPVRLTFSLQVCASVADCVPVSVEEAREAVVCCIFTKGQTWAGGVADFNRSTTATDNPG